MGRGRIKWGDAETYFKQNGFEITRQGGDVIIKAPASKSGGQRNQVRIGHTSSSSKNCEMLPCYPSAIKRAFGIDLYTDM